jgi:hypothetical protein
MRKAIPMDTYRFNSPKPCKEGEETILEGSDSLGDLYVYGRVILGPDDGLL